MKFGIKTHRHIRAHRFPKSAADDPPVRVPVQHSFAQLFPELADLLLTLLNWCQEHALQLRCLFDEFGEFDA